MRARCADFVTAQFPSRPFLVDKTKKANLKKGEDTKNIQTTRLIEKNGETNLKKKEAKKRTKKMNYTRVYTMLTPNRQR